MTKLIALSLVLLAGCSDDHYIQPDIERVYVSLKNVDSLLIRKITEHDTFAVKLLREEQEKLELKYKLLLNH